LVLGSVTLAWAAFVFTVINPFLAGPLRDGLFGWAPAWLDLGRHVVGAGQFGRGGLVASWMLGLVVGSLLVPVVEELYFRGFLLPRL
jgi:uncharacterized protein